MFSEINSNFDILENMLYGDPLFVDPENSDFHFFSDSPCINAGTPDTTGLNLPEYDLDGNPRIYDNNIDMGCYEWQGTKADDIQLPISNYELRNHPNPFNPSTTITFSLNTENITNYELSIYNLKGQKIKIFYPSLCHPELVEGRGQDNQYSVIWSGTDQNNNPVSSGIYFYQLKVDGEIKQTKKMLLLK